jgi:acyl-coenzyme A thioesterase PaaI-like protein
VSGADRATHHDLCFGCGIANVFGMHLEAPPPENGELRGRFFVKQDLMGPPGVMHGGLVATALDEVMSLLVCVELAPAPTARLETDLRAPIPLGTFVEATARIVERDARKVTATAELRDEAGALLAEGRAVFVLPA